MNGTQYPDILQGVQDNSNGLFGITTLAVFWFILFVVFMKRGHEEAMLASSFIVTLVAGVMWGLGILETMYLGIVVVLLLVSIVMKRWT